MTLVQEPDAELIATLQRFGDGPPAAEVPNSVHVALCLELRAVGRDATHLLGAFHCPKKARDAVVKAFSQEYHGESWHIGETFLIFWGSKKGGIFGSMGARGAMYDEFDGLYR